MDQGEWIELGVLLKFCAEPECQTHGLVALTPEEHAEFEEGGDPCVPVLRLWHEGEAPGSEVLTSSPGATETMTRSSPSGK
jgi:hypothetical protein